MRLWIHVIYFNIKSWVDLQDRLFSAIISSTDYRLIYVKIRNITYTRFSRAWPRFVMLIRKSVSISYAKSVPLKILNRLVWSGTPTCIWLIYYPLLLGGTRFSEKLYHLLYIGLNNNYSILPFTIFFRKETRHRYHLLPLQI